jgi:hypothetical protein
MKPGKSGFAGIIWGALVVLVWGAWLAGSVSGMYFRKRLPAEPASSSNSEATFESF